MGNSRPCLSDQRLRQSHLLKDFDTWVWWESIVFRVDWVVSWRMYLVWGLTMLRFNKLYVRENDLNLADFALIHSTLADGCCSCYSWFSRAKCKNYAVWVCLLCATCDWIFFRMFWLISKRPVVWLWYRNVISAPELSGHLLVLFYNIFAKTWFYLILIRARWNLERRDSRNECWMRI